MLYFSPWISSFPTSNSILIGDGVPGLERVKYPLKHLDEVDLHVFPDVYFSDVQLELERQGKRVWGARNGDIIELYRYEAKQLFKKLGLPVGEYWVVDGLDDLRAFLRDHPDVWIKVSCARGDMESWHSVSYDLSEPRLDELEHRLGAKKHIAEFIVEATIEPACEVGFDGYTVDGQFPQGPVLFGKEEKDTSYFGHVVEYKDLPEPLRFVNEKLSPWLAQQCYRGWFSTEVRITKDGTPYLIDPCCRLGSPPSELYQEMFSNWADVVWNGADGQITELEPVAEYGVLAMVHSAWADKNWQPIHFPQEIDRLIKLRNWTRINGVDYCVPQSVSLPEIGAVIGMGGTVKEAWQQCRDAADTLKGYFVEVKLADTAALLDGIEDDKEYGIDYGVDEDIPPESLVGAKSNND